MLPRINIVWLSFIACLTSFVSSIGLYSFNAGRESRLLQAKCQQVGAIASTISFDKQLDCKKADTLLPSVRIGFSEALTGYASAVTERSKTLQAENQMLDAEILPLEDVCRSIKSITLPDRPIVAQTLEETVVNKQEYKDLLLTKLSDHSEELDKRYEQFKLLIQKYPEIGNSAQYQTSIDAYSKLDAHSRVSEFPALMQTAQAFSRDVYRSRRDVLEKKSESMYPKLDLLGLSYQKINALPDPTSTLTPNNFEAEMVRVQTAFASIESISTQADGMPAKAIASLQHSIDLIPDYDTGSFYKALNAYKSLNADSRITEYRSFKSTVDAVAALSASYEESVYRNLRTFSPADFNSLYASQRYQHVGETDADLSITGDAAADEHITKLAESRGYRKQKVATDEFHSRVDNAPVQEEIETDLVNLKQYAKAKGVSILLTFGYRSPKDQRQLFTDEFMKQSKSLHGKAYTPQEIASGKADESLQRTMNRIAIPGYSKHHTGYVIDIMESTGYRWISDNNYANAKRFGFIPSYPKGLENQGPNPEPWEFIWVGRERLRNDR